MVRSSSGYPLPEGLEWIKTRFGELKENIGEVKRLAQAIAHDLRVGRLGALGTEVTDWNLATEAGFYWTQSSGVLNKPPGVSWSSGHVYRNNMATFERVIQDVVMPTTNGGVGNTTWRRIGYLSGGVWAWGIWEIITWARGTSAQRDSSFGVPASDATRVALANRRVRWWNTDYGWEEQYYAVTGLSGLTVPGLESGIASGWYPVGAGPKIVLNPGASVSASAGNNISGWSSTEWHRGGTAFLSYSSGVVTVTMPGRYRVRWRTTLQTGAGELDMWLYVGSTFANDAWELNSTRFKTVGFEYSDVRITGGDTVRGYVNAGTCDVHVSSSSQRGEFVVEYIGPRLVTA